MNTREEIPIDLAKLGLTEREVRELAAAKRAVVATGQAGRIVAEVSASGRLYPEGQTRTDTGLLSDFERTSSTGDSYEYKHDDTDIRPRQWVSIYTSR